MQGSHQTGCEANGQFSWEFLEPDDITPLVCGLEESESGKEGQMSLQWMPGQHGMRPRLLHSAS